MGCKGRDGFLCGGEGRGHVWDKREGMGVCMEGESVNVWDEREEMGVCVWGEGMGE